MFLEEKLFEKTCADCGQIFKTNNKRVKLCALCKKKHKEETNRKTNNLHKRVKPKSIKCKGSYSLTECITLLEKYNKKNNTQLSYGKFVELMNRGVKID